MIYGVRRLDEAAAGLWEQQGLDSLPGGSHPAFGTANRIVPVGEGSYLELMGIGDEDVVRDNPLGRWVLEQIAEADRLLGLSLACDDIDEVALRLGRGPVPGERLRPDGSKISWRSVGIEAMIGEGLPFFISWDVPDLHPSRDPVSHRVDLRGFAWVEIGGDPVKIKGWVGEHRLPLRFIGGEPGLRRAAIATGAGEIVLP